MNQPKPLRLALRATLSASPSSERMFDVVASTPDVNRYGYILEQSWNLDGYLRNPVVLFDHPDSFNSADEKLPIGRASAVRVEAGELRCTIEFAPPGVNPLADRVCALMGAGFLNAVSVGFIPSDIRYEMRNGNEVPVAAHADLLEISVVPVPADSGAVVQRNHLAFEALQALAKGSSMNLSIEALRKALSLKDDAPEAEVQAAVQALATENLALRAQVEANERTSILERLRAEKKVTPALETWLAAQPLEGVRAFASDAPVIPALLEQRSPERQPGDTLPEQQRAEELTFNGKRWGELDHREMAQLHAEDPSRFYAMKAAHEEVLTPARTEPEKLDGKTFDELCATPDGRAKLSALYHSDPAKYRAVLGH